MDAAEMTGYRDDDTQQPIVVGGYTLDRGPPVEVGQYRFEPAPNVLECNGFDSADPMGITCRLRNIFGPFDYVAVSEREWSVERPGEILGTLSELGRDLAEQDAGGAPTYILSRAHAKERLGECPRHTPGAEVGSLPFTGGL